MRRASIRNGNHFESTQIGIARRLHLMRAWDEACLSRKHHIAQLKFAFVDIGKNKAFQQKRFHRTKGILVSGNYFATNKAFPENTFNDVKAYSFAQSLS